ncbi:hypothetical protein IQ06DRAFT_298541 [Phaeosphaeriaceae sp. SRC1lsM3a]|nr:hypothetical protein IQ06DRAFT_298541 [Stagonospora sp. SRC1lsM3a]
MDTHQAAPPNPAIPASKKYAHLYMPVITASLIFTNREISKHILNPKNAYPMNAVLLVAASAIPTHYVASSLYEPNRPEPTPEQVVRFTRKHDAYRALVLATYGRLYGTPFNLRFVIADFMLSYAIGALIGERPAGTRQRRSEFLVALLWVIGSGAVPLLLPPIPTLDFWTGAFDRTVWRAAYVALVDDIIGILAYPNVRTLRGRITLVLAQAFTITSLVYFALAWIRRYNEGYFRSAKVV